MRPANSSSSFTFASTSEESFSLMSDAEAVTVGREPQQRRDSQKEEGTGSQQPGTGDAEDIEEEEVVEETEDVEETEGGEEEEEGQEQQAQEHAQPRSTPAGDKEREKPQQQQQQQQQPSQSPQQHHSSSKEPARETDADKQEEEPSTTRPEEAHHAEVETMQKAEFDLEAASRDMFGKLNSAVGLGIKSLGQLTQHPPAAGSSLSKFAEGLTSGLSSGLGWWNTADSESQSRNRLQELTAKPPQSLSKDSALLQLFGLSEDEQVVEQFPCKMLQTYGCRHNTFTPVLQMAFQGTMYLTDRHMCFSIEERGKQLPIKVPLSSIRRATRQLPVQKGAGDLLHLELENKDTYIAFRFESGSTLDSALALIEHLTES